MVVSFLLGAMAMWLLMRHPRSKADPGELASGSESLDAAAYAGGGFDLTLPMQSAGDDGGKSEASLMEMFKALGATEEEARDAARRMVNDMKKHERLLPQLIKDAEFLPATTKTTTTRVEIR